MPSDFLAIDTNFPTFTAQTSADDKITSLYNYVYLLVEQLRYSLFNLDTRNFNKTALDGITEPIMAKIRGGEGRLSELYVTAQGLESRVQDAEGNISTLTQTANGLQSTVSGLDGDVSVLSQTVDGLTVTDRYGTTYLNGNMLMTGTVIADRLIGSTVGLLSSGGEQAGTITITGSSSGSYSIQLGSGGALRLAADDGAVYLSSANGNQTAFLQVSYSSLLGKMAVTCGADTVPGDETCYLGASGLRWAALYAVTGTIQTSDLQKKNSVGYGLSEYEALFDRLKPVRYKLNDGTSGRYHIGFIAQDVEEELAESGLSTLDFGGFVKSPADGGGYDYGLRYEEFIALNTTEIQRLKARVAELESRIEGAA